MIYLIYNSMFLYRNETNKRKNNLQFDIMIICEINTAAITSPMLSVFYIIYL